ncbi:MAG: hypothetical protein Q6373_011870 [Candidatus Sigynarchaeota archaeon]
MRLRDDTAKVLARVKQGHVPGVLCVARAKRYGVVIAGHERASDTS